MKLKLESILVIAVILFSIPVAAKAGSDETNGGLNKTSTVALNPQPEPPTPTQVNVQPNVPAGGTGLNTQGINALNPQPEPPGKKSSSVNSGGIILQNNKGIIVHNKHEAKAK